jgi:metal-dependent HD superfamily phosphatase/phosphodiesterase
LAIDSLAILPGEKKPVRLTVFMNNSAGIFQVEEALASKINVGPLADQIELVATTRPFGRKYDRRILYEIKMEGRRFVPAQNLR